MKTYRPLTVVFLLSLALTASATIRYVDVNSTNSVPPFLDWNTAATNIQDAVDVAVAGDEVVVTNGIYATGGRAVGTNLLVNRVAVDRPITLRSVNGPGFTTIQGYQVPGTTNGDGAVRCVFLTNGANLFGFTLTNGGTLIVSNVYSYLNSSGGGIYCVSRSSVVSNCVLVGNSAHNDGGGAFRGTLSNCSLSGNSAGGAGGGANTSALTNCALNGNWTVRNDGGGAYFCTLYNCTLTGNSAGRLGGGAASATLDNCTLSGNSAPWEGGGVYFSTLNNCLLIGNSAKDGGGASGAGGGGGALVNCTLVGNMATAHGGGLYGVAATNCIIYNNTAPSGSNYYFPSRLNYCCTFPLLGGVGNITNAPLFVDYLGGDLRLQTNSPCINAGNNLAVTNSTDLDGHPRIVNDTVDIGAYEFQGAGSLISYAWLQQYGWPTDGSADSIDADNDGLNNWQEWCCWTDPTSALSALRLLSPAVVGSDLLVRWESVANRTYFLEVSPALSSAFTPLATGIRGLPGTTTYTNTLEGGPLFYRVGVQP